MIVQTCQAAQLDTLLLNKSCNPNIYTNMTIYKHQKDFPKSILKDNHSRWMPIELPSKGSSFRFQIFEHDAYVVELRPRDGMIRALLSKFIRKDRVKVVQYDGQRWIKLFTRFENYLFEPRIVLVKTKRLETLSLEYASWKNGNTTTSVHDIVVESVIDPDKFATFMAISPNILTDVLSMEFCKYLENQKKLSGDIRKVLEGESIDNHILEYAGYQIRQFSIIHTMETTKAQQNQSPNQ